VCEITPWSFCMKSFHRIDPKIRCKFENLHLDGITPIRLNQAFNYEMVEAFHEDFNELLDKDPKFVPVIIDSYGGDVYCLLELVSLMLSSPVPVATICNGKAMSCGAMLFMFGSEGLRFMSEHATLMIHEVSSFNFGKVEEIKSNAKEVDRLNAKIFQMAAKHIGHKENYFLDLLHATNHSELYLTAKDAKKHNICNHVGVPQLVTEIKVTQTLTINNKEIPI
jgi:ATP-dependent protease ClpP protease subunit